MRLKTRIANLDEVDEKYHELYTERNGAYFLNADDSAGLNSALSALSAEREARKTLAEKLKSFESFDVESYKKFEEEKAALRENKTVANGDFQAALDAKVQEVSKQFGAQIAELKQEREQAQNRLNQERIQNLAMSAANKLNAYDTALDDVSYRVSRAFVVEDGNIVARQNGAIMVNEEGQPVTVEGYVKELSKQAPHLFKQNQGTGLRPGFAGIQDGAKVINPRGNREQALVDNLESVAAGKAVLGD